MRGLDSSSSLLLFAMVSYLGFVTDSTVSSQYLYVEVLTPNGTVLKTVPLKRELTLNEVIKVGSQSNRIGDLVRERNARNVWARRKRSCEDRERR